MKMKSRYVPDVDAILTWSVPGSVAGASGSASLRTTSSSSSFDGSAHDRGNFALQYVRSFLIVIDTVTFQAHQEYYGTNKIAVSAMK